MLSDLPWTPPTWRRQSCALSALYCVISHLVFSLQNCNIICMHESLSAAKDEIRRLREIEQEFANGRTLQQETTSRCELLLQNECKLERHITRLQEEVERLGVQLEDARARGCAAGDRAVAEAAAAAVMKEREEKAVRELVDVRRQVRERKTVLVVVVVAGAGAGGGCCDCGAVSCGNYVFCSHLQCSWISWAVRVSASRSARAPFIYLFSTQSYFTFPFRCIYAALQELVSQLETTKSLLVSERARSESLFQQLQVPVVTHTITHNHTQSPHTRSHTITTHTLTHNHRTHAHKQSLHTISHTNIAHTLTHNHHTPG
jgi:hypothetical protein